MPEMRMNSLKSRAMNCGPLSEMIRGLASRYLDRKSTRLNSSHSQISYAVFCLKKKKKKSHLIIHQANYQPFFFIVEIPNVLHQSFYYYYHTICTVDLHDYTRTNLS